MRKLFHFVPVMALCFGLPGAFADLLALEGKVTVSAASGREPAPFVVEGTVFQMTGEALSVFAKENGAGEYIVEVEGDFNLQNHKVAVNRITLREKVST